MSGKHRKVSTAYILASTITGCISISAFASILAIPIGITSCPIG